MATMVEKAKAKANALGDKVKGMTVKSGDDVDTPEGEEKQSVMERTIASIMEEMTKMKSLIRKCGYRIGAINVTLGLPPAVIMIVKKHGKSVLGAEELDGIIEREQLSKTQTAVLKSFKTADRMQTTFAKTGLELIGVSASVSIPPTVTLQLQPIEDEEPMGET